MHYPASTRKKSLHLYDPKEEGVGIYDVHYINAYKKKSKYNASQEKENQNSWRNVA